MAQNFVKKEITPEIVNSFLEGNDPQERIVNLEYSYKDNFIKVYYRNENDEKCMTMEPFYPFLWAKKSACQKLCGGDRNEVKELLRKYNIGVKALDITNKDGKVVDEIANGYTFIFFAREPMSYSQFLEFFKKAKNPIYNDKKDKNGNEIPVAKRDDKQFLSVTPQEQYLISTGKRFFKGYDDYDQTLRLIFDLETTGLNTETDRIEQFGIRFNRPVKYKGKYITFEKIYTTVGDTKEEKDKSELENIITFLKILYTFKPDIITAHNGEAFDWCMIIGACKRLGHPLEELSKKYFEGRGIVKNERETILKLGGEIETFHQTIVPTCVVTDSLHAVRRAQAIDSNMLFSNLKYVTKYSKIVKKDRVYVPGDKISKIWNDDEKHYAFNKEDGDWYIYKPDDKEQSKVNKKGKDGDTFTMYTKNTLFDGYELVGGKDIVQQYLLDDLWECDKVEHRYNIPNFLICKMLPVPFQKCCTMGTAGQWKSLMLAWSYENNLAIPSFGERCSFTGGLSRLLRVGFVSDVAKFDYNSLYPSIILTWAISDKKDLMYTMLAFLEHVLTQREKYKKLKKTASKKVEALKETGTPDEILKWKEEESANDKKQLPLKILGNSFFGSYGAPNVFPWGSIDCAERTTCTGRQSLRLMIYWFNKLGYAPIVGDSVTEDTPLFIRYKDIGWVDIKPISELINEDKIKVDELGREYDYSTKNFLVLCRSGWVEPSYIYRHKTDKKIYEVSDNEMRVDVTEDHSLFNNKQEKIKPSEIEDDTKLEYYIKEIELNKTQYLGNQMPYINQMALALANGEIDRVPTKVLNYSKHYKKMFYETFIKNYKNNINFSKTCLAGLMFLKKSFEK